MECPVGSTPPVCISVLVSGLRRKQFVLPFLALLISPAFAGESSYKPPTTHYYCTSNPAPQTRYYSGLFDMPASGPLEQQTASAFQQFLSSNYGVHASASCQGNPNQNAKALMQQQITQLKASKWKIIETGWTNSGAGQASATDTAGAPHPEYPLEVLETLATFSNVQPQLQPHIQYL